MNTINEFNSFDTLDELLKRLADALIDKSIFKWKMPEDFDLLLESMMRLSDDQNILFGVAGLGRVEAVLKKPVFNRDKANQFLLVPPDFTILKEGDDRLYAALFIKRLSPDWIIPWAQHNIWAESSAEKVRLVFQDIVVDDASSFETTLLDMGKAGLDYAKSNQLTETKVAARFLRVLKGLRSCCKARNIDCDIAVGKSIDTFVGLPFSHFTTSETQLNTRKNLVPEIVGLLLDLVGQRFSLAIECEHYAVIKRIRKWCSQEIWREISKNNAIIEKLSDTIAEALLILARQNIADGELLKRLEESTCSHQRFNQICERIAKSGELDKSISAWFMDGGQFHKSKKTISSEVEVSVKGESVELGDLLLSIHQGKISLQLVKNALDDLELFDPSLVPPIRDLANHWSIVTQIAENISSKRSINLVGSLGDKVRVDRKLYDVVDNNVVSQYYGVVVRPAIVISSGNKPQVIKKGVVKIIEDQ